MYTKTSCELSLDHKRSCLGLGCILFVVFFYWRGLKNKHSNGEKRKIFFKQTELLFDAFFCKIKFLCVAEGTCKLEDLVLCNGAI